MNANTPPLSQLHFNPLWNVVPNIVNITAAENYLKAAGIITRAVYAERFTVEIEYITFSNYYALKITEGKVNIKYATATAWKEMAAMAQLWINSIQEKALFVNQKLKEEEKISSIKVSKEEKYIYARLTTWRNMDWAVEKFRNVELEIGEEKFALIDTFESFEQLLIDLQKSISKDGYIIHTCFFCRYSNYNVAGNDNFGDLNCFKHCKQKCIAVKTKHDIIDLFESEYQYSKKVAEIYYCAEFENIREGGYDYKFTVAWEAA
jgi:hypothetical protein